jgi:branched-subunit amino acid aminotransferase/4-amino-4-deoxychorismate lyase
MASYKFFSLNGEILPIEGAVVPVEDVEYSYGFGVYETIRAHKGQALFLKEHCQRLMESAWIIGLEHDLTVDSVSRHVNELLKKNNVDVANIKILLIGGQPANLYILCLNPLFPDRKLYKNGAQTITQHYERPYPHAKTLNMLPSYLAFREAKKVGAYDALAINRDANITEGTRTNFFAIKGRTIYSPPEDQILLGVTRDHVLKVAENGGFKIVEQDLPLSEIAQFDGAFLTSTSSKIMPIKSIDDFSWQTVPNELKELMSTFDQHQTS